MYTILRYIFVLMAFAGIFPLNAQQTLTSPADSAYNSGEYARAVDEYLQIARTHGVSSNLLYNLGNAYARVGDYGNASVAYLRALRLDPHNNHARNNLNYIDSKVHESNLSELRGKKYSLDMEDQAFFTSLKLKIARDHLSNDWATWAAVLFILFICCLATYIFARNVLARKIGFFGGITSLGLCVIMLIFSWMAASYKSNEGVILAPKVKLMSDASRSSKESPVNLTRGTRLTILDSIATDNQNTDWYKVRLNSDFVGWIPAEDFVVVGL